MVRFNNRVCAGGIIVIIATSAVPLVSMAVNTSTWEHGTFKYFPTVARETRVH